MLGSDHSSHFDIQRRCVHNLFNYIATSRTRAFRELARRSGGGDDPAERWRGAVATGAEAQARTGRAVRDPNPGGG
jgi:hypothetical protein